MIKIKITYDTEGIDPILKAIEKEVKIESVIKRPTEKRNRIIIYGKIKKQL